MQLLALCNLGLFICCEDCVYIIIILLLIQLFGYKSFLQITGTATALVLVIGSESFLACVFFAYVSFIVCLFFVLKLTKTLPVV